MKEIKVGTVFSGIGSPEQALKRLNVPHKVMFACDNGERLITCDYKEELAKIKKLSSAKEKREYVDKLYAERTRQNNYVQQSYLANYPVEDDNFYQDVILLDGTDFENKVDLFVGGSPCQSFSIAGARGGFEDTRGTLFFEIVRILDGKIKEGHPVKFILLENVKQLVAHDNGKTYETIVSVLRDLGYIIPKDPLIVSPVSLGIPQNRERVFIPGIYKDFTDKEFLEFNIPKKQITSIDTVLDKDFDKKYKISEYEEKISTAWDEFHRKLAPHFGVIWVDEFGETYDYSDCADWRQKYCRENRKLYLENKEFIDAWIAKYDVRNFKLRDRRFEWQAGPDYKSIWETVIQLRQSGIRCKRPTNFQTLVAMVQTPVIGKLKRRLTPREAARLQSFPDSYVLNKRDDKAYKQLGNSANVEVIKFIANQLFNQER